MLAPKILYDLQGYLETHRYFHENQDALACVMETAFHTLDNEKTPTDILHDFQQGMISIFPHPSVPYGENTDRNTLLRFASMTSQDIRNEARYNVVMAAYMDVARAHMVTSGMDVHEIRRFEHTGTKLLSS